MAVHHAVGISCQRNSGYRPSRINIMAQGLSTPDPSLSPTHLSIRRGRATTTHYTHYHVSLVVSRNTTLVPSLGLCIGPACEAGPSAGTRRERVLPQVRKKERRHYVVSDYSSPFTNIERVLFCTASQCGLVCGTMASSLFDSSCSTSTLCSEKKHPLLFSCITLRKK